MIRASKTESCSEGQIVSKFVGSISLNFDGPRWWGCPRSGLRVGLCGDEGSGNKKTPEFLRGFWLDDYQKAEDYFFLVAFFLVVFFAAFFVAFFLAMISSSGNCSFELLLS